MLADRIHAINGTRPFDLVLRNCQIVNVFNDTVQPGCVGIVGNAIAYVGAPDFAFTARQEIDCGGQYLLPGFIDAHMHLESSMLTPARFARIALSCGTTTVAADPHEIANVLGVDGVRALTAASRGLPLRVLIMAPSTIPSAPGVEDSGFEVGPEEVETMLELPGIHGLGEVMDFNAVADGDAHMLSVVEAAAKRGAILDGHASVLTGRRLQAFRAAGIDSDHTTPTGEKLLEELALGFNVQVQEIMLSEEMVAAMNSAPLQDRICLVTDDVPLPRLMHDGHLNHVAAKAIALGLDPMRAIRFTTINAATRLRLYDLGGIAPGMVADLQLVPDLKTLQPSMVFTGGRCLYRDGAFLETLPESFLDESLRGTMHCAPVTPEDFRLTTPVAESFVGGKALVNVIHQNGVAIRTQRTQQQLPLQAVRPGLAELDSAGLCRMAVLDRYGRDNRGFALVDGHDGLNGAVALTYSHDCHDLNVFGSDVEQMALAANTVIQAGGGLCAVRSGQVVCSIPLPLAGLMSEDEPEELLGKLDAFLAECTAMGFRHQRLLSFFMTMALAVSPEIKCTDRGLLDVVHKRFLPLIETIEEDAT